MEGGVHNQFRGEAENVVQVRDIHGDLHVHQSQERSRQLDVPRQLPTDVPGFVGREDQLAWLDALVTDDNGPPSAAVTIGVVTGTAGVGKTALAVHWAHRMRDRFPEGQLYVDLRGYSHGIPVSPEQALEGFQYALGAPTERIPAGLEAQAALFRSLLGDRRILIVLDNAHTPEQVRPLLPGSSSCLVIVTSRSSLAGLVSRNGATRLTLDRLYPAEALVLLRDIVGAERIDAELATAQELARHCAYLPLALRIAAERAAAEAYAPLRDVVMELAVENDRLDVLAAENEQDPTTAVRAVFSWSYRGLPATAARMFRLLGLHQGPTFSVEAAAALADVPTTQAKRVLQTLAAAHLVEPLSRGRYQVHDLLHAYAAERTETEESPSDRFHAERRVLTWYLHTADTADRILLPLHDRVALLPPESDHGRVTFIDRGQVLSWCETECANLVAAARRAAEVDEHRLAEHLARALWGFFDLRKPWAEWIATFEIGLAAARHVHDEEGEAWILSGLGSAYHGLQRFDEAVEHFTQALTIRRAIGNHRGVAGTLTNLGSTYRRLRRFDDALACFEEALAIRRATDDLRGQGGTLNRLGATYRDLGRLDESLEFLRQSLEIRRQIGDRHGEGFALHSLGATFEHLDRLDEAATAYHQSLTVRREIGDRRGEAENLHCLGKILLRTGDIAAAITTWQQALSIYTDIGAPEAADVSHLIHNATPRRQRT